MLLFFIFCNIIEQTLNNSDYRIMLFPIKKIGHTPRGFSTDYQRMSSAAFVINKKEHIDIHLKLIFVQINIVGSNWVWESVEMVALKHFVFVTSCSKAMLLL